ncbi:unnamed protein product [Effrenium voratum]|nr:unnamed protein product [Effrenium voratum]
MSSKIKSYAKTIQPQAVLLQECANESEFGHDIMPHLLQPMIQWGYKILQEGEFITALRDTSAVSLALPRLSRQQGKILAVRSDSLNMVLLNVHLRYDQIDSDASRQTRSDLEKDKYPGSAIFFAGDTNRVPRHHRLDPCAEVIEQLIDELGLLCMPSGPTNVCWNGTSEASQLTYADFAADLTRRRAG